MGCNIVPELENDLHILDIQQYVYWAREHTVKGKLYYYLYQFGIVRHSWEPTMGSGRPAGIRNDVQQHAGWRTGRLTLIYPGPLKVVW